jgi:hypothetical protein
MVLHGLACNTLNFDVVVRWWLIRCVDLLVILLVLL